MTVETLDAARWWRDATALRRVVADLLGAEMALMHPGTRATMPPWPQRFDPHADLHADLGADSLDMMGLATSLDTMLHLNQAQPAQDGDVPDLLARTDLAHWLATACAALEADGSSITFRTSGSSGTPKPCRHALASLWQECGELARLFSGRIRIVSVVPSHHIYGFLFTVLLPHRLGLRAANVLDLRGLAPGEVARRLQAGDLVVGFPDFWRTLAQPTAALRLPPDVVGVTSTAPCPDDVARSVLDAGLARLVQVYGSSETAGVGWRDGADADYRLLPYWSRSDDGQRLRRALPDGSSAEHVLQDRIDWREDERREVHFRPAGRVDQAVQVGGVNVFPAYVSDVVKLHPAVLDASVRLMRADEGHRLKAFVVARDIVSTAEGMPDLQAAAGLRSALHTWLGERLAAPECPAAISFGPALPRGASGKLADWIIDAWA